MCYGTLSKNSIARWMLSDAQDEGDEKGEGGVGGVRCSDTPHQVQATEGRQETTYGSGSLEIHNQDSLHGKD